MVTQLPQAKPKTVKGPYLAERILYHHNAEHHGKADGADCGQEACAGLRKKERTYPKPRRIQRRKNTWENSARFAFDVFEGFQRKELALTVAVDLTDEYNRVQFKLRMELLVQHGASLTLTRWLAAALQERKVAMRLGNWISTPQQLTMGLPQGSPHPTLPRPQSSTMSKQRD